MAGNQGFGFWARVGDLHEGQQRKSYTESRFADCFNSRCHLIGGKPCVRGHRVPVHRIAGWWRLGLTVEEIAEKRQLHTTDYADDTDGQAFLSNAAGVFFIHRKGERTAYAKTLPIRVIRGLNCSFSVERRAGALPISTESFLEFR